MPTHMVLDHRWGQLSITLRNAMRYCYKDVRRKGETINDTRYWVNSMIDRLINGE